MLNAAKTAVQTPIPVFKPSYGEEEVQAVRECLTKGWSGLGPKVKEFEETFAKYIGVKYAVATSCCTASLHLSLQALDIKKGTEVISTPMTFVSTNHAILFNGGIPVFADIEPDTLNISVESIRKKITPNTKGIIVVHFGGHACDMEPILRLARERGLFVLEDVAHGCGGEYKGRKLGSLGNLGCFSFHAVKNMAVGDGGMITTNDQSVYERLVKIRWLGISKDTWNRAESGAYHWDYSVNEVGYKYQMNDIAASIGLVQLKKLEELNRKRNEIAKIYDREFASLAQVKTPPVRDYAKHARHNYVVQVKDRDGLMRHLVTNGISAGVHYRPNNHYPMYADQKGKTPVADAVWTSLLTLPLFPSLNSEEINYIVQAVKSYYSSAKE